MQHVYDNFLDNMVLRFKVPSHIQVDAFLNEVVEDLKGYSPPELQGAWEHFRVSRKYTTMPAVGDLIAACEASKSKLLAKRASENRDTPWHKKQEKERVIESANSPQRRLFAKQKLQECPLAKQAANEDWIGFLFDHYRYHNHTPTCNEVVELKAKLEGFNNSLKLPTAKRFKGIHDKMIQRREKLRNWVLHGEIPQGI